MARKWQSGVGTWCSGSRPVFLTPCCFFLPGGCGDLDGESEAGGVVGCLAQWGCQHRGWASSAALTCVAVGKVLAFLNLSSICKVGTVIVPPSVCCQDDYQLLMRISALYLGPATQLLLPLHCSSYCL